MFDNKARVRCFSLFLSEGVQGLRVAKTDRYGINTDDKHQLQRAVGFFVMFVTKYKKLHIIF